MTQQNQDRADPRPQREPDQDVVAEAAARLLVEADRAVSRIREEAARAAGEDPPPMTPVAALAPPSPSAATPAPAAPVAPASPEAASPLRDDPAIAEIHEELASVQSELGEVSSGVIGLQTHGLRQTGIAALLLAVLIAIAWKVIGG